MNSFLPPIDHLVVGTPTLDLGMEYVADLLGRQPIMGGKHPGFGTHNALIGLGTHCYLEVIAPDPTQLDVERPLWIDVDSIDQPKLIRWAFQTHQIALIVELAKQQNYPIGDLIQGNRKRPDGQLLSWILSNPRAAQFDGMLPFFIDWRTSIHPAVHLPTIGTVHNLIGRHPSASEINKILRGFDMNWHVVEAPTPNLSAEILIGSEIKVLY